MSPSLLVTRTDRLGDVMMALPTLHYLRDSLPEWNIDFACRPEPMGALKTFLSSLSIGGVVFPGRIHWRQYQATLLLHPERKLCLEAWLARVPVRVGPLSKPWTFFLLNKGARQRRSEGVKNEAEYNLALAEKLVLALTGELRAAIAPAVELPSEHEVRDQALRVLADLGITPSRGFIVVHPGMGGSATNLAAGKYVSLLQRLRELDVPLVLSRGPSSLDAEIVSDLSREIPGIPVLQGVPLPVLREVFRLARAVVAPATGPLHLAHYCGATTLGIYSEERSQCKERWAPWGGTGKAMVVELSAQNLPERAVSALRAAWGTH